jgi:PAS domain S-box-containing protein
MLSRKRRVRGQLAGKGHLNDLEVDYRTGEERWQSLLENPIFGVTFLSKDHRYEGTNQTFQTMVGYTGEELRGISPLEPIREVWIHDEWFAARRLSIMRIMARRTKAATVVA